MGTRFDMIGIFVNDLHRMVMFYQDVLGFEIAWDGKGPYAEFKHEGIRFSMYERAQLPGLLGQAPTYPKARPNIAFQTMIRIVNAAAANVAQ